MNLLAELRCRFEPILADLVDDPAEVANLLDMIRPAQDARFGDYQANMAMPLKAQLGKPPRDIAQQIVAALDVSDLCDPPEVAGPGFINLKFRTDWLAEQLAAAAADDQLGVAKVAAPRTYIVDFSSPNVAKPMHVGHIRSTVIGDALCRTLRFLGHEVISDNHLGDWGTQFGMIIYGYKHFLDEAAYKANPVRELGRLYKHVRKLMDYRAAKARLPKLEEKLAAEKAELVAQDALPPEGDKAAEKKVKKALRRLKNQLEETEQDIAALTATLKAVETDPALFEQAEKHADIGEAVLGETARLHAGDEANLRLWKEFLPACIQEIERVYQRLGITFDHQYGESFYHDQLAEVVADLERRGMASESEGAICVFLDDFDSPMIVRKRDGAYLYATTDLATIRYRMSAWQPDAILYVVDFRQGEHFEKLFATARRWNYDNVELKHVSFGTVLGDDGRPFRTRAGDSVELESLLDEAESRALAVVSQGDDNKPGGGESSAEERTLIAGVVGMGALKYADLSQNRTSDYVFSYDKMLALNGNTATYMQYAYARVQSIFRRGEVDIEALRASGQPLLLNSDAERALALEILRFSEALAAVAADYRPNLLTNYLFDLSNRYSTFFEHCPVLKAESDELRASRLLLCDLTARVIKQGLELLGIDVVPRM